VTIEEMKRVLEKADRKVTQYKADLQVIRKERALEQERFQELYTAQELRLQEAALVRHSASNSLVGMPEGAHSVDSVLALQFYNYKGGGGTSSRKCVRFEEQAESQREEEEDIDSYPSR
jgi:hypothetical protein